jgi:hypothetical protein
MTHSLEAGGGVRGGGGERAGEIPVAQRVVGEGDGEDMCGGKRGGRGVFNGQRAGLSYQIRQLGPAESNFTPWRVKSAVPAKGAFLELRGHFSAPVTACKPSR